MKRLLALLCLLAAIAQAQSTVTPAVAVMPLLVRGLDSNAVRVMEDALTDGLIRTGKYRIMERSQMASILDEQGFQRSGACDGEQCAVQIGKLLGVERSLIGSVGLLGKTYVLNVRMIDISTGEAIATSQRSFVGEIDKALTEMIPQTVSDLTHDNKEATAESGKKSRAWLWWTVGGLAAAGGATAAVLLLSGSSNNSSSGGAPSTTGSGSVRFTWIPGGN